MAEVPPNIPGSDAALEADDNSSAAVPLPSWEPTMSGDDDDEDETEDPTGKGIHRKHPSQVFSWELPKEVSPRPRVRGGNVGPSTRLRLTPGARTIQN